MLTRSLACLFVVGALSSVSLAQDKAAPAAKPAAPGAAQPARAGERLGDAYALTVCAISGEKLGGMGEPVVKNYDGREVRFCCKSCVGEFEKDKAAGWAKVDEQMVKDQTPFYPMTTSVVSGKTLDKPVDFVWNNRLVRLADEGEKAEFKKDAAKYMAALDKAVIEKQSKSYALKNCPMMGDELDPSDHKNIVVANRLIEVCCSKCQAKVKQNPSKALAALSGEAAPKPAGGK